MKRMFATLVLMSLIVAVGAQTFAYPAGDPALEAMLKELGPLARTDAVRFYAELEARLGLAKGELARIATRYRLQPEEAYLAAYLAKHQNQTLARIMERLGKAQGKAWGALAQEMGIKPGSPEFRALKSDCDGEILRTRERLTTQTALKTQESRPAETGKAPADAGSSGGAGGAGGGKK